MAMTITMEARPKRLPWARWLVGVTAGVALRTADKTKARIACADLG